MGKYLVEAQFSYVRNFKLYTTFCVLLMVVIMLLGCLFCYQHYYRRQYVLQIKTLEQKVVSNQQSSKANVYHWFLLHKLKLQQLRHRQQATRKFYADFICLLQQKNSNFVLKSINYAGQVFFVAYVRGMTNVQHEQKVLQKAKIFAGCKVDNLKQVALGIYKLDFGCG